MPRAAQPTAGHSRVRRRPKCHGRGLVVNEANSTAVATKIAPCIRVAMIVNAGDSLPDVVPVAAAAIPTTMKVATTATRMPVTAYQAGHGGAVPAPSGSSGGFGGAWVM